MKNKKNIGHLYGLQVAVYLAVVIFCTGASHAQGTWSQATACPGWNNPTNFTTGSTSDFYYQGRTGTAEEEVPDVMDGTTGCQWTGSVIAASAMASKNSGETYGCVSSPGSSTEQKVFYILSTSSKVGTHPANRDPNTGDSLQYVPTQFNTNDTTGLIVNTQLTNSIRIGDACAGGKAAGLYYNMKVNSQNAMLFIYYACVVEAPGHGTEGDPAFIIRVMREDDDGTWNQVSDTLAYVVTSTPKSNGGSVVIGQDGWEKYSPDNYTEYYYKKWAKVSLNLSNLLYENVRIEVMIRDCPYTAHFAYALLAGECRPMLITSSGCPAGMSTDVTTLAAPRGLDNYVWYASEYGQAADLQELNPGAEKAHFTFRQLTESIGTEADGAYLYNVQADDFHITKRGPSAAATVAVDSMGNRQTFRCTMTSALDPKKPFESHLYTNVQNTKPTMMIDTLSLCGGDILLKNESHVPGDVDRVDLPHTVWTFYNNPACLGASDSSAVGDSIWIHCDDGNMKGVRVKSIAFNISPTDPECYSEAIYPIRPLPNPNAQMTVSKNVLCDDETTTLADVTAGSVERRWVFRSEGEDSPLEPNDTVIKTGENTTHTRGFNHAVEPIEMIVRNGLYYIEPGTIGDTVWCEGIARDTVRVFLHPELEVLGDTIVCKGKLTDATVNAVGVDDCTYEWSTSLGNIEGDLPAGNHLAVTPYAEKSTYYVRVTSPQGCVAWDSIHCYLVVPQLEMQPQDGRICPGDVVTLTGSHANSYSWLASPEDPTLAGQDTMAEIHVTPKTNTVYTLIGHGGTGENRCDADPLTAQVTVFPYPEPKVTLTPGIVDSENPTITLRDDSKYSVSSSWEFNAGVNTEGREVTHTFDEATGVDSVFVTLTTTNELNCKVVYPFSIPVTLFTAWLPNIFSPGSEDENSAFRLYTINAYEYFHIYIYNRFGLKVFDSTDPGFEWDGSVDGTPLPQGTYTYIIRYRKPGTYTVSTQKGSVTLIR